jgi:hypothetical protein
MKIRYTANGVRYTVELRELNLRTADERSRALKPDPKLWKKGEKERAMAHRF